MNPHCITRVPYISFMCFCLQVSMKCCLVPCAHMEHPLCVGLPPASSSLFRRAGWETLYNGLELASRPRSRLGSLSALHLPFLQRLIHQPAGAPVWTSYHLTVTPHFLIVYFSQQ